MIICVHCLCPSLILEQQDSSDDRLVGRVKVSDVRPAELNVDLPIRIEPNPESEEHFADEGENHDNTGQQQQKEPHIGKCQEEQIDNIPLILEY